MIPRITPDTNRLARIESKLTKLLLAHGLDEQGNPRDTSREALSTDARTAYGAHPHTRAQGACQGTCRA